MKRSLSRFAAMLAAAMTLSACSTLGDITGLADPIVQVVETVGNEPTIKNGMTSRDAAYRSNYGSYVKAKTTQRPIFEMEGIDGQHIELRGVKSLKVYANSGADNIAAPTAPKSALVEFMDSAGRLLERVFLPLAIVKENSDTERMRIATDGNIRQSELVILGTAVSGSQRIAGEALNKEPTVITVPAEPAAPTAP
jgi:hypothetical protein